VHSFTEKLTPPNQRERERWRCFGYEGFTGESDFPSRRVCQLRASDSMTLVIPPWCGLIGKLDRQAETAQPAMA
jgi:hypothetical protein